MPLFGSDGYGSKAGLGAALSFLGQAGTQMGRRQDILEAERLRHESREKEIAIRRGHLDLAVQDAALKRKVLDDVRESEQLRADTEIMRFEEEQMVRAGTVQPLPLLPSGVVALFPMGGAETRITAEQATILSAIKTEKDALAAVEDFRAMNALVIVENDAQEGGKVYDRYEALVEGTPYQDAMAEEIALERENLEVDRSDPIGSHARIRESLTRMSGRVTDLQGKITAAQGVTKFLGWYDKRLDSLVENAQDQNHPYSDPETFRAALEDLNEMRAGVVKGDDPWLFMGGQGVPLNAPGGAPAAQPDLEPAVPAEIGLDGLNEAALDALAARVAAGEVDPQVIDAATPEARDAFETKVLDAMAENTRLAARTPFDMQVEAVESAVNQFAQEKIGKPLAAIAGELIGGKKEAYLDFSREISETFGSGPGAKKGFTAAVLRTAMNAPDIADAQVSVLWESMKSAPNFLAVRGAYSALRAVVSGRKTPQEALNGIEQQLDLEEVENWARDLGLTDQ